MIRAQRGGTSGTDIENLCRLEAHVLHAKRTALYEHMNRMKQRLNRLHTWKRFPPFPETFLAKSPALLKAFIADYWLHRDDLHRELKTQVSKVGLAIDHKKGDAARIKLNLDNGAVATQIFTVIGDLGIVLNYCVVPDTNMAWTKLCMEEVYDRHRDTPTARPTMLHVDCGCCNGKLSPEARALTETDMATGIAEMEAGYRRPLERESGTYKKVLDAFHMLNRVYRQANSKHPRFGSFCAGLRDAIYVESGEDEARLEGIRAKHNLNLTAKERRATGRNLSGTSSVPGFRFVWQCSCSWPTRLPSTRRPGSRQRVTVCPSRTFRRRILRTP
jgi:hypothetical protein